MTKPVVEPLDFMKLGLTIELRIMSAIKYKKKKYSGAAKAVETKFFHQSSQPIPRIC